MALADVVRFEVVAAVLVDGHLAGVAAVALSPETPDAVLTLLTVGHLEPLGDKGMAVDSTHLLPSPSTSTVVDPHCRGSRERKKASPNRDSSSQNSTSQEVTRWVIKAIHTCKLARIALLTAGGILQESALVAFACTCPYVSRPIHLLSSPLQSLPGPGGIPSNTGGERGTEGINMIL